MTVPPAEATLAEIVALHRFFELWMGQPAAADDTLTCDRLEAALGPGFLMVAPGGSVRDRAAVVSAIRAARGCHFDPGQPFRIWIECPEIRAVGDGLVAALYQEWQRVRGAVSARLSTALFRAAAGAPNGLHWVHLHETWMAGRALGPAG